ncbi:DUF7740 domain-containing protein [Enterobacter roggenkampii]|nr:hypothetical protein [Enterobacter roggenkampii]
MTDISREVCEEYLDALVTVELSVRFAQLEDRKINATIRATVTELLKRIRDKKIRAIFAGLARQPFPDGALKMMRRQLDSLVGEPVCAQKLTSSKSNGSVSAICIPSRC